MSFRAGCLAILVGLLAAVVLFAWSETESARSPLVPPAVGTPSVPAGAAHTRASTPVSVPFRPPEATPSLRIDATRADVAITATAVRPLPSPSSGQTGRQVAISLDELERALKSSIEGGSSSLRNPSLRFLPPDRVSLRGEVPIAVFHIPVEIEARLLVDQRGTIRVTTGHVEAVGASLPGALVTEIGRRVDDQGTRAIQDALPPGALARRVTVESDRIRVDLTP